jgi:hypothetical protein
MPLTTRAFAQEGVNLLEQVAGVFAKYVDAKPHYLVGTALFAMHTHIYINYSKSPRLSVLSPVITVEKAQFWLSLLQWCGTQNK